MKPFNAALRLMPLCVIPLCLCAQDLPPDGATRVLTVSHTDHLDFPPNGTLKVENSTGELTIAGWDQPGIEITTIKSTKQPDIEKRKTKDKALLDRVEIQSSVKGNQVVVDTQFPHRFGVPGFGKVHGAPTSFGLEYRIRVPRAARVDVAHNEGEVHIEDISGNVQVKSHQGLITVNLSDPGMVAIHAHAISGNVDSDFPGSLKHNIVFGHAFTASNTAATRKLDLDIGYGDIVILNMHKTPLPPPVGQ